MREGKKGTLLSLRAPEHPDLKANSSTSQRGINIPDYFVPQSTILMERSLLWESTLLVQCLNTEMDV